MRQTLEQLVAIVRATGAVTVRLDARSEGRYSNGKHIPGHDVGVHVFGRRAWFSATVEGEADSKRLLREILREC